MKTQPLFGFGGGMPPQAQPGMTPITGMPPGGGGAPVQPLQPPGLSPQQAQPFGPPPGLPPQLAALWGHLPPQLQGLLGGAPNPFQGLLGGLGIGGQGNNPLAGLFNRAGPSPVPSGPMVASGNPYPVKQSY